MGVGGFVGWSIPSNLVERAVSEDGELLGRLLAEGLPVRSCGYQLSPINRCWPNDGPERDIELLRSEELFSDVLSDVGRVFAQRRTRSASRGWQAKFPSARMGRTLKARSHLELRLLELCEVDARVTRFVEQPICLFYGDTDGKRRKHIPDLYLEVSGRGYFIEAKWERDAAEPKNESRWPSIGGAINGLGFGYEVLTERHILRQPRAGNVASLLRYRRCEAMAPLLQSALRNTLSCGSMSFADVWATWPAMPRPSFYRALTEGWVWTDLDLELGPASHVQLVCPPEAK